MLSSETRRSTSKPGSFFVKLPIQFTLIASYDCSMTARRKATSRVMEMSTLGQSRRLDEARLYAIPVQLLAYRVAIAKGADFDQPRNLTKSGTVK
jgi:glucosamine 6-phosphate synthetase-like amidotransferase/phosphosugar isomerase protein